MNYVYLTGAHSSGKSSLLEKAGKDNRFSEFLFLKEPVLPFINMGYMFKIPENKAEYNHVLLSQMHLLGYTISVAEINISLNNSVMCDRSLFDVLSYIYFYAKDDKKINTLLKTTKLGDRIKNIAPKFNKKNKKHIFLFEPVKYEDNGFRLPEKYVGIIHDMLVDIYQKYGVEYEILKSDEGILGRINQIYNHIHS